MWARDLLRSDANLVTVLSRRLSMTFRRGVVLGLIGGLVVGWMLAGLSTLRAQERPHYYMVATPSRGSIDSVVYENSVSCVR